MKRLLLTLLLAFGLFGANAQIVVYSEDFESVTFPGLPNGWSKSQGPTSVGWQGGSSTDLSSQYFNISRTGKVVATNDDKYDNQGGTANLAVRDRIITPAIDISAYTGVSGKKLQLQFDYLRQGKSASSTTKVGFCYVDYSPDNGATWRLLDSMPIPTTGGWKIYGVNVTRFKDSTYASALKLAFRYNDQGAYAYGFALDNFAIVEQPAVEVALTLNFPYYYISTLTPLTIPASLVNKGSAVVTFMNYYISIDGATAVPAGNFTGSLAAFNSAPGTFIQSSGLTLPSITTVGSHTVKVYITNPNNGANGADGDHSNDTVVFTVNAISSKPPKNAVLEEFTGAWCQFCPDGATKMAAIKASRGDRAIIVSMHNGDDMDATDGVTISGTYNSGYPSMMVDRIPFIVSGNKSMATSDRNSWDTWTGQRLNQPVPVAVSLSYTYDKVLRNVSATVSYNSLAVDTGDFRFNLYIVEDSVSGFGSGYDQVNYYNTQASSPWFQKGNPIVGYQHRHVFRNALGGAYGDLSTKFTSLTNGGSGSKTYTFALDGNYNEKRVELVGLLHRYHPDLTKREILNSASVDLIAKPTAVDPSQAEKFAFSVSPNPVSDYANINVTLPQNSNLSLTVSNLLGQDVYAENLGNHLKGEHNIVWNAASQNGQQLPDGIYFVKLTAGNQTITHKVVVAR
jgi:hypothetical protein